MESIEKELDRLVQMLCINHICHICGTRSATAVHHIIGRANPVLRYDVTNLLPVCNECHRAIHDKGVDVSGYVHPWRWEYLQRIKNKSYKDILTFEMQMSEKEYFKQCRQVLKGLLGENIRN